jgi:hypothetical protein
LGVPQVEGRYYTVQICDEWGNVITNINERNYPPNPFGTFAFVTPDSVAGLPKGAVPIVLPSRKAKMLARVELQTDWDAAVALQRKFTMSTGGTPKISAPTDLPLFDNRTLAGVEIFDYANDLLSEALDTIPVAPSMQAKVREVARVAADPSQREALQAILRNIVVPRFLNFAVTEAGSYENNWLGTLVGGIYGDDYWTRTAANLVGIWANSTHEVIYFIATRDGDGNPLDGSNSYSPLERDEDGGLSIFVAPAESDAFPSANWLPVADGKPFSLTFRTYVPKDVVKRGGWFPPSIRKLN